MHREGRWVWESGEGYICIYTYIYIYIYIHVNAEGVGGGTMALTISHLHSGSVWSLTVNFGSVRFGTKPNRTEIDRQEPQTEPLCIWENVRALVPPPTPPLLAYMYMYIYPSPLSLPT